ncbi:hypothetical protein [Tomitella fengzijianii]|uniref:Uncharacterized protein n=1 Tax=Tomitella fengzijianii TaxID=2597660 RepID=A0A516X3Y0_9ACTN|nr:hypothetical protein [Tomitella fengzijianii]QDQ97351.1 hypothetical protein FO059_08480 [Tomitella fengzijianii]
MRQNFPGLIAWTLFLIGLGAAGVWLVILGRSGSDGAVIPGVIALVCLIGAGALWLSIRLLLHNDPMNPEVLEDEEKVYLKRRRDKRNRRAQGKEGAADGEPV